jgi:hypothetical protein
MGLGGGRRGLFDLCDGRGDLAVARDQVIRRLLARLELVEEVLGGYVSGLNASVELIKRGGRLIDDRRRVVLSRN